MQIDIIGVTLGIFGIIIGIFVSYYYYKKSLRSKEPYWTIQSNNIVRDYSSSLHDLKILYKKKAVKDLTISKILIWNKGAETIHEQDIQTRNPFRVTVGDDVQILDVKTLTLNNPSSQFEVRLQEDNKSALIDFDYLDQDQGAVIQVIHTGISSESVKIIGDIKGVKKITNPGFIPLQIASKYKPHIRRKILAVLNILGALVINIVAVFIVYGVLLQTKNIISTKGLISIAVIIFIIIFNTLVIRLTSSLWHPFSPSGLEVFEEEIVT